MDEKLKNKIEAVVEQIIADRKAGDFEAADFLRRELRKLGIEVRLERVVPSN